MQFALTVTIKKHTIIASNNVNLQKLSSNAYLTAQAVVWMQVAVFCKGWLIGWLSFKACSTDKS